MKMMKESNAQTPICQLYLVFPYCGYAISILANRI